MYWTLFPFSFLYYIITSGRNLLFQSNIFRSIKFEIPVISVGNLEVGGTGKTPMTEYLIRHLDKEKNIALLSRGYKRKSKGFRIISDLDNAETAGDEPFQCYMKYKDSVTVAVGKHRELAIPEILKAKPEINLIILDDAFQYRTVKPSLNIMLTRHARPFYKDTVMPTGRLREAKSGVKRSDVIVMTKCPSNLSEKEASLIKSEIRKYHDAPVFFVTTAYEEPVPLLNNVSFTKKVLLVSGIANSSQLEAYVQKHYSLLGHIQFNDHHDYTEEDFVHIKERYRELSAKEDICILITEKDATKWLLDHHTVKIEMLPVFSLPISTKFLFSEAQFHDILRNALKD